MRILAASLGVLPALLLTAAPIRASVIDFTTPDFVGSSDCETFATGSRGHLEDTP
jgi:hypothetical protein